MECISSIERMTWLFETNTKILLFIHFVLFYSPSPFKSLETAYTNEYKRSCKAVSFMKSMIEDRHSEKGHKAFKEASRGGGVAFCVCDFM